MATIALRWDRPTYSGHLYTEIWRAASQLADTATATVEAGATEIGESIGSVFFDTGRTPGTTYWYYLRHVNTNGEKGAFTERDQEAEEITTADLADDAVTFAKLQNIATDRLLGRTTASAGSVEELDATSARALLGLGALALKGSVETSDIASNAVTLAKFEQIVSGRVLGRQAAGTGNLEILDADDLREILGLHVYEWAINNDTAQSFDNPAGAAAVVLVHTDGADAPLAMAWARTTASPAASLGFAAGPKGLEVSTGVLAGTDGSDNHITLSAHSDGKIYLENRYGWQLTFRVTVLSALSL